MQLGRTPLSSPRPPHSSGAFHVVRSETGASSHVSDKLIGFPPLKFLFPFFQLSSSLALESGIGLGCEGIGPTLEGIRDAGGKAFLHAHVQRGNVHPYLMYHSHYLQISGEKSPSDNHMHTGPTYAHQILHMIINTSDPTHHHKHIRSYTSQTCFTSPFFP